VGRAHRFGVVSGQHSADTVEYSPSKGQAFLALRRLLVIANVPSSSILVTLMMETLRSSETSVLTRATWHNILEDRILHSYCKERQKLKNGVFWDVTLCGSSKNRH
jgi:hypothetical protein